MICNQLGWKRIFGALLLMLALPCTTLARPAKHPKKPRNSAPVVSRAQMELAQQMVRNAYALGRSLQTKQRVALMTRLLYTMHSDVMAVEKKQWAEELFVMAQRLPRNADVEVDSSRNAAIATAAARLALYDADRALDLLDTLPPENGNQPGPRTMAARLVFAGYMQHHGSTGASILLAHASKWGERGGFPYSASAMVLGRLRENDDAADGFFRQILTNFERGQEGLYGVSDFSSLLEQAVAIEAISEPSAEEAGQAILTQLRKLTEPPVAGNRTADSASSDSSAENSYEISALTDDQKGLVAAALNNVRGASPKAYEDARKTTPALFTVRAPRIALPLEIPKIDIGLQSAFSELADAMREHRSPDQLRTTIARGLQVVNEKYKAGACAECASPDQQSWALVSLSAFAAPNTIATQLNTIEDPFWHAYFLAIAAQQVGQPTRVADPTARKVAGKEEAEPE